MKTTLRKQLLPLLAAGLSFLFMFSACDKDTFENNNQDPTYSTTGNANGSQQTPPVTTSATGNMTGAYNARTNVWEYTINWSGLSGAATAVQINGPAAIGASGSLQVALTITTAGVNGSAEGTVTLTEEQQAYLLAGQLYYTILSTAHVGGEIRGQITATFVHE